MIIKELVKIANELDSRGLAKEAGALDEIITTIDAYGRPMTLEDDALYYIVRVSDKKYLMNDQSDSGRSYPNIEEPDFEHLYHDRNRNPRSEHVWKGDYSHAAYLIRYYNIVHHYPTGKPWKDRVQLELVKQNKEVDNAT